jgi:hypothetical protein
MDNSLFLILLVCALAAISTVAIVIIRYGRSSRRGDSSSPFWFWMNDSSNPVNPDSQNPGPTHHHSHGGFDAGSSHHHGGGFDHGAGSGGFDGGSGGSHH